MKLCKDCKYSMYKQCHAPQNYKDSVDLVTGEKGLELSSFIMCGAHRELNWIDSLLYRSCGKRGRWFKAKEDEVVG